MKKWLLDKSFMSRTIGDRVRRTEKYFFFTAVLSIGVISGCISQEKYDSMVLENHALRQENAVLKTQPELFQAPQRDRPHEVPVTTMNNQELKNVLRKLVGHVEGEDGVWNIEYDGIPMAIITSPPHNRMRIVSPISKKQLPEPSKMKMLLKANFDRALDARYAMYQGRIWSVYLHPLRSLTEAELESALKQVANLVKTFGTTYSSGSLYFGN